MAKSPAFQFYVQDFLMGTMHFTAEEVGAYIRLLCYQWDKNFIPKDEKIFRKITGISKKSCATVLEKFIENGDGNYINQKLESVREAQIANSLKNKNNGSKGGRPKTQPITETKPKDNPDKSTSSSSSSSTSSSKEENNSAPLDLSKSNLFRQPKIPTIEEVREAFVYQKGTIEMADKFFLKHNAVGWYAANGPIVNFKSLIPIFMDNWRKNMTQEQGEKSMKY